MIFKTFGATKNLIMKIINWIKNKTHIHFYNKPLVSKYISFSQRDIIFECECGKRKMKREVRSFSEPFTISTTFFITKNEMEIILNKE